MSDETTSDTILGEKIGDTDNMNRWIGCLAVVTGASSGIGQAICVKLLKMKVNVVGVGRRLQRIEEITKRNSVNKGKLYPIECDLRNEADIVKTFQSIDKKLGSVGILVNAAGVLLPTTLLDGSTDMWKETIDVNFIGLTVCVREAIKSMQKHNMDGQIININCLCGHAIPDTPFPCFNIYSSTKHALTALTETVRRELNFCKSKIKISMISPDVVNTELNYNIIDEADTLKMLTRGAAVNPEDVGDACVYILGTPPHVGVHDIILRSISDTH